MPLVICMKSNHLKSPRFLRIGGMMFMKNGTATELMCPYEKHQLNILIVESDPDLMTLYLEFFTKRNIHAEVTSKRNECLTAIKQKDYDIIIRDKHLTGNLKATDLAKEIYHIRPAQRIVLTTTNPLYRTSTGIKSFRVTSQDVLVKPFHLSNLMDVIENRRNS